MLQASWRVEDNKRFVREFWVVDSCVVNARGFVKCAVHGPHFVSNFAANKWIWEGC